MLQKSVIRIAVLAIMLLIVGMMVIGPSPNPLPNLSSGHTSLAAPQETVINLAGAAIRRAGLATADFNGDGYKEIIAAGSDGVLYILSTGNGSTWNVVWSRQTNDDILAANPPNAKASNLIESTPAVADLEGDGHLDIVVALGGDVHQPDSNLHYNGGVLVYRYNSAWNFSLLESLVPDGSRGWPQPRIDQVGWPPPGYSNADGYWDGITTTPALGDLDGDGDLEIVVEGIDRRIHAWHHTGQTVAGWPIYSGNGDNIQRGGLSSPALGDIDGDGLPEVVVGSMNQNGNTLWAINGDSTNVPGFPLATPQLIMYSPALADIDNDGLLEIIVSSGWGKSGPTNQVFAWNHDGTSLPNWPRQTAGITIAPPAIGDIDNDGQPEIVVGCGWHVDNSCHLLYAWNPDGSLVPGFPSDPLSPNPWISGGFTMPYDPILADFDGDGTVEIIVAHHGAWGLTIVEPNGVTSDNTSRTFSDGLVAAPLVDDVDNDGLLEILAGGGNSATGQGVVKIWHESGSITSERPWPMFRQNLKREGLVRGPPKLAPLGDIKLLHQGGTAMLPTAKYTLLLQNDGSEREPFDWSVSHTIPELQITPNTGTNVENSVPLMFEIDVTGLGAGWNNLGNVTIQATKNGEDIEGSPRTLSVSLYIGDLDVIFLPLVLK